MAPDRDEGTAEAVAWAHVLSAWGDEDRHRAYLAGCVGLDALARAGGRYRDVLAERPADPVALRWRDEVVRRVAVAGLAALPRTSAAPVAQRRVRAAAVAIAALSVVALGLLAARVLLAWGRP